MSELTRTDYGFKWGQIEVTRLAEIQGRGQVLGVAVGTRVIEIYASPKGRSVRVREGERELLPPEEQG